MYVEGVNRKSRILFSFQLLLIDDNEMRLVSRSLRRRNHACKYILVHVHGHLQLYTCTLVKYMYILLCCHGNNRFSIFVPCHHVCQRPHHRYNNVHVYIYIYTCIHVHTKCTTGYVILLHEERHQKTTTVPCCLVKISM